jgi:tRNA threonylcarbamoyladenosine modification (KEOPS) complex  Pcc1 subunit
MSVLRQQGVLQRAADGGKTHQRRMTNRASFVFHFPSFQDASVIVQSLSPEISHKIPKSNVTFTIEKKMLMMTIESEDVSTLRAACNSYLRWVQTACAVRQLV